MSEPLTTSGVPPIEMTGVAVGAMRDLDTLVAEDVNWSVAAGDFWVVAGLQRSGKSDFLMMTAGLMPPLRGTYRLFGDPMSAEAEEDLHQRLRLGLVFDGGQLFNQLTVAENIALPLRYHRALPAEQIAEQVNRLLELTELMPWANSTPGMLGRNWQKRAGLARALALHPEVLLLDNPLGGADTEHAGWWLNFLGQLSAGHEVMPGKRPTTLVVTADDVQPWRASARQFARLHGGKFETGIYD